MALIFQLENIGILGSVNLFVKNKHVKVATTGMFLKTNVDANVFLSPVQKISFGTLNHAVANVHSKIAPQTSTGMLVLANVDVFGRMTANVLNTNTGL